MDTILLICVAKTFVEFLFCVWIWCKLNSIECETPGITSWMKMLTSIERIEKRSEKFMKLRSKKRRGKHSRTRK